MRDSPKLMTFAEKRNEIYALPLSGGLGVASSNLAAPTIKINNLVGQCPP
jgi:hypothetical protein